MNCFVLFSAVDSVVFPSFFEHMVNDVIYYWCWVIYVAAKATYIRLLHGKISFLGGFSALAP